MESRKMLELSKSIEKFLFLFDESSDKFGRDKVYQTLREHFKMISNFEDVVINVLLDGLEDPDSTFYVDFMEEDKIKENAILVKTLIDTRLLDVLNKFI